MKASRITFQFLAVLFFTCGLGVCDARADDESPARTPAEIGAAVDALHVDEVPWREVAWRTCLVQGLNESRETNKPLILWMFIDRPIDDERC